MHPSLLLFAAIIVSVAPWLSSSVSAFDIDAEVPLRSIGGPVHVDLFTGTATTGIPIAVPAGRNGMQPNLQLAYESAGGNGWVGMGWKLEHQGIFRQTKWGIDFANNAGDRAFVVRMDGLSGDLVQAPPPAPSDEWRAKMQGSVTRIRMVGSGANLSWEVTTPQGRKLFFGTTDASRVRDPADLSRILGWCLDRVEDPDGNYMTFLYTRDQNQLYVDRIDYAGHGTTITPTNQVKFYLENGRPDPVTLYMGGVAVTTAKRLRSIQVIGNGNVMRTYQLTYGASGTTTRSLLTTVQQFGKDATVSASTGAITNESTASKLPAVAVTYTAEFNGAMTWDYDFSGSSQVLGGSSWVRSEGDFNGKDGTDLLFHYADSTNGGIKAVMCLGQNSNRIYCQSLLQPVLTGSYGATGWSRDVADINGDGTTDLVVHYADTSNGGIRVRSLLSQNGSLTAMSETQPVANGVSYGAANWNRTLADVDGDGKADLLFHYADAANGGIRLVVLRSNGDGTFTALPEQQPVTTGSYGSSDWTRSIVDVNGDGRADVVLHQALSGLIQTRILLSNNNGTFAAMPQAQFAVSVNYAGTGWARSMADMNGDGNPDLVFHYANVDNTGIKMRVALSKGDGTMALLPETQPVATGNYLTTGWVRSFGDANGDGKADLLFHYGDASSVVIRVLFSKGDGTFTAGPHTTALTGHSYTGAGWMRSVMDVGGDGLAEVVFHYASASTPGVTGTPFTSERSSITTHPMLLSGLTNGMGGTFAVRYAPASGFKNTARLHQATILYSCADNSTPTVCSQSLNYNYYRYAGGYYHVSEREFRGYHSVSVEMDLQQPAFFSSGLSCFLTCSRKTTSYFHQGSDVLPNLNNPSVPVAYMNGKLYKQITYVETTDQSREDPDTGSYYYTLGAFPSTTTFTYEADADGVAPYFTPVKQIDTTLCDLDSICGKQTRVVYSTDSYGNKIREDHYGDLSTTADDKTIVRTFSPNTDRWLLAFPTSETVYEGIGTSIQKARTEILYDGTGTSCASVADGLATPTNGHPTRMLNWLNANPGASPVSRLAYDSYGNQLCSKDRRGNTTSMTYDATHTYPTVTTDPLGHTISVTYFAGTSSDLGLYGQLRTVTDVNGKVTAYEYDKLGRGTTVTAPDTTVMTMAYNSFGGGIHVQNVQTTVAGLTKKVFFDGLGKTLKTEETGPDTKTIVVQSEYTRQGLLYRTSLPRFTTDMTVTWAGTNVYDLAGRLVETAFADGTKARKCFDEFVSVAIDADGHRKRETRDSSGHLLKVEEYSGAFSGCDASAGTPYATSTYQYDVLGNLRFVTDAKGNRSEMQYDSLSRKTSMHDPDMGDWSYEYDAAGNLTKQIDAKGQSIWFQYDELNRKKQKDYATQKVYPSGDVVYLYDVDSTFNRIGRLRRMQDATGSLEFRYDPIGRITRTDRVLDGVTYTTQLTYDGLGREATVVYPSGQTLSYTYSGPWVEKISEGSTVYVQYDKALYKATGQPGKSIFGNGVSTTYVYTSPMNRLYTLTTQKGTTPAYQDLRYAYSNAGTVKDIYDATVAAGAGDQHFSYDHLDRLTVANGPYGSAGANTSLLYTYNEIGNLTSNSQVGTYTYPASGVTSVRPHAVSVAGTNSYSYDLNGNMTSGAGRSFDYDFQNKPTCIAMSAPPCSSSATKTMFVYDGAGARVKKTVGANSTRYINMYYECDLANCSRFIWAGNLRVATIATNGTVHYWHGDHLGSLGVITDSTGAKVQAVTYYPFGGTRTNQSPSTPAIDVPYKYAGQELDGSTGLYNYNARLYDPALGRFITADAIVPNPGSPQDLNRYSYVRNNPINLMDPTGHVPENYCPLLCPPPTPYSTYSKIPGVELVMVDWSKNHDLDRFDLNVLLLQGQVSSTQYAVLSSLYLQQSGILWLQGIDPFTRVPGGSRVAEFRALEAVFNPPSIPPSSPPPPSPIEVSTPGVLPVTVTAANMLDVVATLQPNTISSAPEGKFSLNITVMQMQLSLSLDSRPSLSTAVGKLVGAELQFSAVEEWRPGLKEVGVGPVSLFLEPGKNSLMPQVRGFSVSGGYSFGSPVTIGQPVP